MPGAGTAKGEPGGWCRNRWEGVSTLVLGVSKAAWAVAVQRETGGEGSPFLAALAFQSLRRASQVQVLTVKQLAREYGKYDFQTLKIKV